MNLSRLDLNLLVVFDALMRERNVTRAAGRLHLSQPAVSHALARLRSALGDPLLVRDGRSMTPTPRAEALLSSVRPLLSGLEQALHGGEFAPANVDQEFRFALPDIAEWVIVPPLLRRLAAEAPRARLALLDVDLDAVHGQLARGELDAAVVTAGASRPGIHARHLVREDRVVGVLRRGHPATRRRPNAEQLRRMPRLAVTLGGGRLASPVEGSAAARKHLGEVRVSTSHLTAAAATLRATDLVLVIGELGGTTLASLFDLAVIALPVKLPAVESSLIWHERTHHDPAQRWFRDAAMAFRDGGQQPPRA